MIGFVRRRLGLLILGLTVGAGLVMGFAATRPVTYQATLQLAIADAGGSSPSVQSRIQLAQQVVAYLATPPAQGAARALVGAPDEAAASFVASSSPVVPFVAITATARTPRLARMLAAAVVAHFDDVLSAVPAAPSPPRTAALGSVPGAVRSGPPMTSYAIVAIFFGLLLGLALGGLREALDDRVFSWTRLRRWSPRAPILDSMPPMDSQPMVGKARMSHLASLLQHGHQAPAVLVTADSGGVGASLAARELTAAYAESSPVAFVTKHRSDEFTKPDGNVIVYDGVCSRKAALELVQRLRRDGLGFVADLGPITTSAAALAVAEYVDSSIGVVAINVSRMTSVALMLELLGSARADLTGFLCNEVPWQALAKARHARGSQPRPSQIVLDSRARRLTEDVDAVAR